MLKIARKQKNGYNSYKSYKHYGRHNNNTIKQEILRLAQKHKGRKGESYEDIIKRLFKAEALQELESQGTSNVDYPRTNQYLFEGIFECLFE